YTCRDSSSFAAANIWSGPALSSSWPFGNASRRMRRGAGIGRLYQSTGLARRRKTSHFGPTAARQPHEWFGPDHAIGGTKRTGQDGLLFVRFLKRTCRVAWPRILWLNLS